MPPTITPLRLYPTELINNGHLSDLTRNFIAMLFIKNGFKNLEINSMSKNRELVHVSSDLLKARSQGKISDTRDLLG